MSHYLNHAATSLPRAPHAITAMIDAMALGSPDRGADANAAAVIAEARRVVADRVGGGTTCFTAGATAALNLAIAGALTLSERKRVAHDPLLHNASLRPLLAHRATLQPLPHDRHGRIDTAALARDFPDCDLLVITHISNVTGSEQPLDAIAELARARGVPLIVDASQSAGLREAIPGDFVAFSAHKAFAGPPGVGALVVRAHAPEIPPMLHGGTGGESAATEMPRELPLRFEAGTPNLPGIAAFAAAASAPKRRPVARAAIDDLCARLQRAGASVVGAPDAAIVSFTITGLEPRDVARIMSSSFGVELRAGLHCAPLAHRALGTFPSGTARVSWNTETDRAALDAVVAAVGALVGSRPGGRDG